MMHGAVLRSPLAHARIAAIERHLDETGWFGFERRESPAVARDLLDNGWEPGFASASGAQGGLRLVVDEDAA